MPTLNWIGKDKIINHHQEVPFRVLEKQYDYGTDNAEQSPQSKIIQGDNLEALKALLPQYESKIKCIYIDPPYNTGNEGWVYNDNVNDPRLKKWLGQVVGKESEDLSRHDKWLCMMYPRLKLLHKLLAEDGVIFVSIDDNEQANLKLMMDEIFGGGNFIRTIACVNNPKGRSDDKYVAAAHESILVYKKTRNLILGGFEPEEKITIRYNKTDLEGTYRELDLRKTGDNDKREDRPNLFYYFLYNKESNDFYPTYDEEIPDGYIQIKPTRTDESDGRWRWALTSSLEDKHLLTPNYMNVRKKWTVMAKDYLTEEKIVKPTSVWDFKDVNSERGTEVFIKYLGFQKNDFPNPKPVGTIERILKLSTNANDLVLDSFAGSGTTAHAVLNLNKQDGGNRQFIMIEMEDYAENITAERVRRVIDGYGNTEGTGGNFSYYTLGETLFDDEGNLNETLEIQKIREYVWFMETRKPYQDQVLENPYLLGVDNNSAFYFYYESHEATTLSSETINIIKTEAESYVVYADNCLLDEQTMKNANIIFKKIPREIPKL